MPQIPRHVSRPMLLGIGVMSSAFLLMGGCVGKVDSGASGTPGMPGATGSGGSSSGNPGGTGTGSTSGGTGSVSGAGTGSSNAGTASASGTGGAGVVTGTGSTSGGTGATSGAGTGILQVPYTRLTQVEYQATIKAAFGVDASIAGIPDDGRVGAYTSNVDVSPDPASAFMLSSEDLAAQIVPAKIAACTAATATTCIPKNFQGPIEKLYRRALTATELTNFSNLLSTLEKAGVSSQDASRELVSVVLESPDFLFRATPISGTSARAQQLTEHLSYALWDAPPDAELTTAAQGATADLGTRLKAQATRLAKDARALTPLARFLAQWLRVDVDNNLADPTYATSPLYVELIAFVQDALTNNVPVTSFVNGTRGFVQKGDFAKYGIAAVSSTANVVPITWPTTSGRRGLIGEELVIDPTRHPDVTRRPIFRGNLVQSSLLCNQIPPPPPELVALASEVTDRTTDTRCMACHSLMEPAGQAFAALDLDHTGTVPPAILKGNSEVAGTYADLPAMLDKIATSQAYADCFSRNLLGFFLEQDPVDVDAAAVGDIATIVKSGGGFADAVAQTIVTLTTRSASVTPWCTGP